MSDVQSKELAERYSLFVFGQQAKGTLAPRQDGNWVRYADHLAALASSEAKLAEAVAEVALERDYAGTMREKHDDLEEKYRALRSQLSSAEQTIAGLKEERYKELKEFFHFVHSQWLFKYGGKIWGEDMLAAYLKSKEGVPDKPKEGGA